MSAAPHRPPPWPEELIAYQTRRPTPPIPSWIWWSLAGLLAVYFTFGLLWIAFADNVPWADADFYFRGAKSMADGNGYSHPFRSGHPPTAFHPVGFPWLLAHVWQLLGVDTASVDHGPSRNFEVHQAIMKAGVPALENVAHLEALPETGAYVVALPMAIAGGSGAPARIVAFVPTSP